MRRSVWREFGAAVGRSALGDFLLPTACPGCSGSLPGRGQGAICGRCRARLTEAPHPRCARCDFPLGSGRGEGSSCPECRGWPVEVAWARSAVVLRPPADALVHGLKYQGWRNLARLMGERMSRSRLPTAWSRDTILVPVPTTRRRERRRGYNQAGLLAEEVARRRGARCLEVLARAKGSGTQVRLQALERKANVLDVFAVRESHLPHLQGRAVIVIDDVLTTGATAGATAIVLSRAGAASVGILTFARALPSTQSGSS